MVKDNDGRSQKRTLNHFYLDERLIFRLQQVCLILCCQFKPRFSCTVFEKGNFQGAFHVFVALKALHQSIAQYFKTVKIS